MKLKKYLKKIYHNLFLKNNKSIVYENSKLKNKYKGQDCYIIGNGYSLKYYDLKKFQSKISITCNNLFYHNDFKFLNCKFYVTVHSFCYSPIWINPYSKRLSFNSISKEFKKKILENKQVNFFLNFNDYLFTKNINNINYLCNFDDKIDNKFFGDPSSYFNLTSSSIETMISLAIYFGFKKIYLVGCDYLLSPQMTGRFYENHEEEKLKNFDKNWKNDFLKYVAKKIDIKIISYKKDFTNNLFEVINYSDFFNSEIKLKKNYDIVKKDDLEILKNFKMEYRI